MTEFSGCFLYSVILASAWDKTIKITVLVLTLRGSQEDYSPQLLFNFLCLNKSQNIPQYILSTNTKIKRNKMLLCTRN